MSMLNLYTHRHGAMAERTRAFRGVQEGEPGMVLRESLF